MQHGIKRALQPRPRFFLLVPTGESHCPLVPLISEDPWPASQYSNVSFSMASYLSPEELAYQMANIKDNRGPDILASAIVLAVLATVAVAFRLACRRFTKIAISWDDYLIIIGLVRIDFPVLKPRRRRRC